MQENLKKEQKAKETLEKILELIKACIARGEKPPAGLIEHAEKALESYPSAEMLALYKRITNAEKDAINAYEYKQNTANSVTSFDDLLNANPLLAIKLFVAKRAADISVAKRLADGIEIPKEERIAAINNALNPRNQQEFDKVAIAGSAKLAEMKLKGQIDAKYHELQSHMEDVAHLGLAERVYRMFYARNQREGKSTTAEAIDQEHGEHIKRVIPEAKHKLKQHLGDLKRLNVLFGHHEGEEAVDQFIHDHHNEEKLHNVSAKVKQREEEIAAKAAAKIKQREEELAAKIAQKKVEKSTHQTKNRLVLEEDDDEFLALETKSKIAKPKVVIEETKTALPPNPKLLRSAPPKTNSLQRE